MFEIVETDYFKTISGSSSGADQWLPFFPAFTWTAYKNDLILFADGLSGLYWDLNPVIGNDNALPASITNGNRDTEYYLSAKKELPDKTIYVCIFASAGWWNFPVYRVDVIESTPEKTTILSAESISKSIVDKGSAAIYGIHFATGNSEINPESEVTLKIIADYLLANPTKRFFVVGHTDNAGDFAANMSLSEARAKAVMNALMAKYGVQKDQLNAYGASSLAPVAGNSTPEGKARNRRVEIVEQ